MKNHHREQIAQQNQMHEALDLAFRIQNAKIGTVFVDFSGHVNKMSIAVQCPAWNDKGEYTREVPHGELELFGDVEILNDDEPDAFVEGRNQRSIDRLREILDTWEPVEDVEASFAGSNGSRRTPQV